MSTIKTVAKNTIALFIAETISRGINIVYIAILARYIQVNGIGMISTAQALIYTFMVLVSFGFDQLSIRDIAATKSRAGAYVVNIAFLRLVLALLFCVLLGAAVQVFHYSNALALIIYIYAISALLKAFTDISLAVFQAFEKMEYNLLVRIFRDGINVSLSLLAIHLRASLELIVGISAFASLLECGLAYSLLRKRFVVLHLQVDFGLCRKLLIAAAPFALVATYPLAQSNLNTVILSLAGDSESVGQFSSGYLLITMVMLIPIILMQAMFPVFSRLSNHAKTSLQVAYQKSFTYLFLLGLAISVGIFLTADQIIRLVLGEPFQMVVPVLKILAWIPLVGFVGHCNGNFLCAVGKERLFMCTEGCFALLYAASGLILTSRFGYIGASYAMLLPTVIGFAFYSILCHRLLHLSLPWKTGIAAVIAALLMAACVYYSLEQGLNIFAVVLLVAPLVYGGTLYLLRIFPTEDVLLIKRALRVA